MYLENGAENPENILFCPNSLLFGRFSCRGQKYMQYYTYNYYILQLICVLLELFSLSNMLYIFKLNSDTQLFQFISSTKFKCAIFSTVSIYIINQIQVCYFLKVYGLLNQHKYSLTYCLSTIILNIMCS